jgi:hypothetical protein
MVADSIRVARRSVLTVLVAAMGLIGCSDTRFVEGECRDVYGGSVCTFAEFTGSTLTDIGVTFPMRTALDAPVELGMVWPPEPVAVLAFPEGVEEQTGFTHFELNWEHRGHQPETFLEPHFDFHFYTMPSDDLETVYCTDPTKPEILPAGYVLPDAVDPMHGVLTGLCVPAMGMHAMPKAQLESGEPFASTMLIGYYAGNIIFVEPMVSRATLLRGETFSMEIPPLPAPDEGTQYPARFTARYDQSDATYRMVLSDFSSR